MRKSTRTQCVYIRKFQISTESLRRMMADQSGGRGVIERHQLSVFFLPPPPPLSIYIFPLVYSLWEKRETFFNFASNFYLLLSMCVCVSVLFTLFSWFSPLNNFISFFSPSYMYVCIYSLNVSFSCSVNGSKFPPQKPLVFKSTFFLFQSNTL